jgi:hypothetical protein
VQRGAAADAVCLGYIHQNEVAYSWHNSIIELLGFDLANQGRILAGGFIAISGSAHSVPEARNGCAARFLEQSEADWLFIVDTDMGFAPDTLERLLEVADPVDRPVVGALCFVNREIAVDGMGGRVTSPSPTLFEWVKDDHEGKSGFQGRAFWPVGSVVKVAATGAACLVVHRSVFEKIADHFGPVWYDRVPNPTSGGLVGEDIAFCMRAGVVGVPIHVHTGVKTSHYKHLWLAEPHYWAQTQAPPATQETAVIVPLRGRPELAGPFMASLRASTGLATVYAVHDASDDANAKAWKEAGAQLVEWTGREPGKYSEKVNLGYRVTSEPWIFICGHDNRFHPGWLDHAQATAGDQFHVIGTNDLGNPRVLAGEFATQQLIRRSYIDEHGASWDGPGVVCHEGYGHQYVDEEIVTVAKQRGVWAMALGSRVEHLHPYWGKGEMDDWYRRDESHAKADERLWRGRLKAYT